jgi:hypothetical protein
MFYGQLPDCVTTRKANATNWSDQLERWRNADEWPAAIFDALLKFIPRKCRTYDARVYSPLRRWNEDAYRTLAVETMLILKTGYVQRRQYVGRCDGEIRAYMATIVRSLMESAAARYGPHHCALKKKLRGILRRERCFQNITASWGLRATSKAESVLPNSKTRAHPGRTERCYLPSDADLKYFVSEFMNTIGGPVNFYALLRVAQVHFGVVDVIECPWPIRRDQDTGDARIVEFEDPRANVIEVEVQTKDAVQKFLKGLIQPKVPRAA